MHHASSSGAPMHYLVLTDTVRIVGNLWRRKLSRISRFCSYPRKVSLQNWGAWHPLAVTPASHSQKFSPWKSYFCQITKVFSLESFSLYGMRRLMCKGGRGRRGKRREREGGRKGRNWVPGETTVCCCCSCLSLCNSQVQKSKVQLAVDLVRQHK